MPGMDEQTRRAAWGIYQALHHLAAGAIVGEHETELNPDGNLFEGDLDYASRILIEDGPALAAVQPDLVDRIRGSLASWQNAEPDRLRRLLGLLRELETLTGSSLPLPLPRDPH